MTYTALEKQIQTVPEEYLDEISKYIDYILYKINYTKLDDKSADSSELFGCIKSPFDVMEIQRRMRNEWN